MSAEEELLQSIFGKCAEEMADTSLRAPHGSGGRVIDIRIFTPETTPELKAGVICEIEVLVGTVVPGRSWRQARRTPRQQRHRGKYCSR